MVDCVIFIYNDLHGGDNRGIALVRRMARRLLFVRFLSDQRRLNPLGIQMLSKSLYEQVFPGGEGESELDAKAIEKSKTHLSSHGLQTGGSGGDMEDIDIKLPPLLEADISTHFSTLAIIQLKPYFPLIEALASEDPAPSPPTQWNYESGWTRYDADGSHASVPFPDDPALVFDVEVCVTEGHAPTLAVAASPSYWYSWVSPRLVSKKDYAKRSKVTFDELIPLEGEESGKRERLVVGHNVSYDRARVREEYLINVSLFSLFFLSLSLSPSLPLSLSLSLSLSPSLSPSPPPSLPPSLSLPPPPSLPLPPSLSLSLFLSPSFSLSLFLSLLFLGYIFLLH